MYWTCASLSVLLHLWLRWSTLSYWMTTRWAQVVIRLRWSALSYRMTTRSAQVVNSFLPDDHTFESCDYGVVPVRRNVNSQPLICVPVVIQTVSYIVDFCRYFSVKWSNCCCATVCSMSIECLEWCQSVLVDGHDNLDVVSSISDRSSLCASCLRLAPSSRIWHYKMQDCLLCGWNDNHDGLSPGLWWNTGIVCSRNSLKFRWICTVS